MLPTKQEIEARDTYFKENGVKIHYNELMKLGGIREESPDPVWEREFGYTYFYVYIKLAKRTTIQWSPDDQRAILTKVDRDHSIIFQIPMQTLHQFRVMVQFYQAKESHPRQVGVLMHEKDLPKACECPQTDLYA